MYELIENDGFENHMLIYLYASLKLTVQYNVNRVAITVVRGVDGYQERPLPEHTVYIHILLLSLVNNVQSILRLLKLHYYFAYQSYAEGIILGEIFSLHESSKNTNNELLESTNNSYWFPLWHCGSFTTVL